MHRKVYYVRDSPEKYREVGHVESVRFGLFSTAHESHTRMNVFHDPGCEPTGTTLSTACTHSDGIEFIQVELKDDSRKSRDTSSRRIEHIIVEDGTFHALTSSFYNNRNSVCVAKGRKNVDRSAETPGTTAGYIILNKDGELEDYLVGEHHKETYRFSTSADGFRTTVPVPGAKKRNLRKSNYVLYSVIGHSTITQKQALTFTNYMTYNFPASWKKPISVNETPETILRYSMLGKRTRQNASLSDGDTISCHIDVAGMKGDITATFKRSRIDE